MRVSANIIRVTKAAGVALTTVLAVWALAVTSTISAAVNLLATTVLAMTGTFTSTPYPAYEDMVANQYVRPALGPGYAYPIGVTTPEQAWPITGLFDLTFGASVRKGLGDLEDAIADQREGDPDKPLLIFGYSQSSVIMIEERRRLDAYYAANPQLTPPPTQFMCIGCLNLPNGGVMARYAGGYIPLIDFYFNGAASPDTRFPTTMVTNRWDGFADSPLYPLWLPSTVNGVLGMVYAHTEYDEWNLEDNEEYFVGREGNTDYYFLPNDKLPLFGPARSLGVPEEVIDVFEPFFTELVELGYDRDIPPWEATRARLVPRIDPFTAIPKLVRGIDEGIDNALELIGPPADVRIPAPERPASPPDEIHSTASDVAETISPAPAADELKAQAGEIPGEKVIVDEEPVNPKASRVGRPQVRADGPGEVRSKVRSFLKRGHEKRERVLRPKRESASDESESEESIDNDRSESAGDTDAGEAAS
ncbi:PE-PPE domain-containing protein [Mycobacterium sp. CPCC 205372]|uniref:PE-PPE domain-containing protein n=1 Tax=Mycobacterium hippophais TaxID=3016340 RepID=A0ABT4PN33_9MYCO|nr:PE-PPE domain-containing protein [Mycobacterium hippophais]MCZ8377975.1 PE-PPE domain-containing protein [Mycobacterium hippophais]